ncbi:MAG: hypothetical protein KC643_20030 [Nitrospira sp.]|nr:hypothetical protein [Nitrospira sp.]
MKGKILMSVIGALWVLSSSFGLAATSPTLDEFKEQVPCFHEINPDTAFSTGSRVRAEYAAVCFNEEKSRAVLHYVAASLVGKKNFPDYDHAPWLGIRLKDKLGRIIWEDQTFDVATVHQCGGYERHVEAIPYEYVQETAIAEIFLGGSKTNHCGPPGNWLTRAGKRLENWIKKQGLDKEFDRAAKEVITRFISVGE